MRKISYILIISLFAFSYLNAELILDSFTFIKQGFSREVKSIIGEEPYLVRCNKFGVWGLLRKTQNIDGNNYLVLKNFLNDSFKYIGPISSKVDKFEGFDFNESFLFLSVGQKQYKFYYKDFNEKDTIPISDYKVFRASFFGSSPYYTHDNIKIVNNKIYLSKSYIGEILNGRNGNTYISIIDSTDEKSDYHYFPNSKGSFMSFYGPNNTIDVNDNCIAVSDFTRYKIYFYDLNYNLIDSLSKEWSIPNLVTDAELDEYENNLDLKSRDLASKVFSDQRSAKWHNKFNTIKRINFINDSTLFVSKTLPLPPEKQYEVYYDMDYDIWRKINGKWIIYKDGLRDIASDSVFVNKIVISSYYSTGENYFFSPISAGFKIDRVYSKEEYERLNNEFYKNNESPNSYLLYRFKH